MKQKIILISEFINPPYDEGIKKTVYQLYRFLNDRYDLQVVCLKGSTDLSNTTTISANRMFVSRRLRRIILNFKPNYIIYIPFAAATFASFIKNYIISAYYPISKNIMISLQPKYLNIWQKLVVKAIKPSKVLTPSPVLMKKLESLGIRVSLLPLYTNLDIFRPIDDRRKKYELRKKFNIPINSFIISHVGHITKGRNLSSLIPVQNVGNQIVVVGSSSTPIEAKDPNSIKFELTQNGIIVIDCYIEDIHEIYQLSDLYIFPVEEINSSIGMPLSILEARACGIPVLTTDFGSIKRIMGDDFGNIFYSKTEDFAERISFIKSTYKRLIPLKSKVNKVNTKFMACIKSNIL